MALLSGMDLRQIALLVGAVLGSGGLVKLDAGRNVSATDQRTTATATVAVAALEEIAALRDDLEVLRRDVRRLRRRELPVSDMAPDSVRVTQWVAATPPPRPNE